MNLHPAPPSSVRLFSAIRHTLVIKKLSDNHDHPLGRRELTCTNKDLFLHFHPQPVERSRDVRGRILYEGQAQWTRGVCDNLQRLIGVDLLFPLTVVVEPWTGGRQDMGDDWCLTTEAEELIQLLQRNAEIDAAVSARLRAKAMEEQELM